MNGVVEALSLSNAHTFSKQRQSSLTILEGLGVKGDAHAGKHVKHRSRVKRDPSRINLRQVHLIHAELLDELNAQTFHVNAGDLGENITTRHINLLALPENTRLHIGKQVVLRVTGLRNPCQQIEAFQAGLLVAVLPRDASGNITRKAGIMTVVETGGVIYEQDTIRAKLPPPPHNPLNVV